MLFSKRKLLDIGRPMGQATKKGRYFLLSQNWPPSLKLLLKETSTAKIPSIKQLLQKASQTCLLSSSSTFVGNDSFMDSYTNRV